MTPTSAAPDDAESEESEDGDVAAEQPVAGTETPAAANEAVAVTEQPAETPVAPVEATPYESRDEAPAA